MMLLAAGCVIQALAFGGGDENHLADSLAKWSSKPAVVMIDDDPTYRSFTLPKSASANSKDVARRTWENAGVELVVRPYGVSASHGVYGSEFNRQFAPWGDHPQRRIKLKEVTAGTVQDGKVTLNTEPGEQVAVLEFSTAKFSRPLKMHWLYARRLVAVRARRVPEVDFLRTLADAVGGKFVQSTQEYRIDFDAEVVRERAAKTCLLRPDEGNEPDFVRPVRAISREISVTAWRNATLDQVTKAFAAPDSGTWYQPAKGSALEAMLIRKLSLWREALAQQRTPSMDFQSVGYRLDAIDLTVSPTISLSSSMDAGPIYRMVGGGSIGM